MRNFERKITWQKVVESKPVLVLLAMLVGVFAWSVIRFWNKMQETSHNKEVVEQKAQVLKEKKTKLEYDLERLNTEDGKEEFIRENYGLAREGEQVIIVVEDKKSSDPEDTETPSGFLSFLRNLFRR